MLVSESKLFDGVQELYRFENGYGASVVRHMHSYGGEDGQWELAVIRWDEEDYEIVYHTPVTDDVLGWLTRVEVNAFLKMIEALGPDGSELVYDDDRQPDEAQEWYDFDPDC